MKRLKQSEVKSTRALFLEKQGFCCIICGLPCKPEEAVLDHCHKGGYVRGVLHRGCNALLGKIENSIKICKLTEDSLKVFLENVPKYLETHKTNQTEIYHYTYKTEEEKKERTKKKARARYVKNKEIIKGNKSIKKP